SRLLGEYAGAVAPLIRDLGGHDLGDILDALARARADAARPTVIFAYTITGYGLDIAGRPQNHSARLKPDQIDRRRSSCGLTPDTEWDAFPGESPQGRLLAAAAKRLERG